MSVTGESDALEKAVNATGYPLQAALAHRIRARGGRDGWRVAYEEHAWRNENDTRSGFIDVVLENDKTGIVLVVECKRLRDVEWILLQPTRSSPKINNMAKGFLLARSSPSDSRVESAVGTFAEWVDKSVMTPYSQEGMFCAVRGNREPSIDKICSELVSATEALAREECAIFLEKRWREFRRLYVPVILTTVPLHTCEFDPSKVSLSDGELPKELVFEPADFFQLRKQFSTDPQQIPATVKKGDEAEALGQEKIRSVFVVHAPKVDEFVYRFVCTP